MTLFNFALGALGTAITADSTNNGFLATNAIDGSDVSYWQNNANQGRSLWLDLGAPQYITELRVRLAAPTGGAYSKVWVQYTNTLPTYAQLPDFTPAVVGENAWSVGGITARYWRVTADGPAGNYMVRVQEVRLMGPVEAPPPPTNPAEAYIEAWLDGLEANYVPTVEEWLAAN